MCIYILLFNKVLKNNKEKKNFIKSYLSEYANKKNIPTKSYIQFLTILLTILTIFSIISIYLCFLLIFSGHPYGFFYLLAILFLPFFSIIFPFLYFTNKI